MATVSELIEQGVTKMRLPGWHESAYIEPRPVGPWADLHDVGAEAVPILIGQCDQDARWEPIQQNNSQIDTCVCGHAKKDHIYEEGACRPGFVCEQRCEQFTDNKLTDRQK